MGDPSYFLPGGISWIQCTNVAVGWIFTKRLLRPAFVVARRRPICLLVPQVRSFVSWLCGLWRTTARVLRWKVPALTGSRSLTFWSYLALTWKLLLLMQDTWRMFLVVKQMYMMQSGLLNYFSMGCSVPALSQTVNRESCVNYLGIEKVS